MRYRAVLGGVWFVRAIFGAFSVLAVGLIVASIAGSGPPVWFAAFWLFAMLWNAYWWLSRIALEADLGDDSLTWRAGVRAGTVHLSDLTSIRPSRFGSNVAVLERRAGRPILLVASKGFTVLTDAIAARRPDLPIKVGWQARLAQRWPGPSGIRK